MYLKTLRVINFKNYVNQAFEFTTGFNALVGPNGSGKTNALDAIHFLCIGKSKFSTQDKYHIRFNEEFYRLEGLFEAEANRSQIVVKSQLGKKKEIELNNTPYEKITDHLGRFPLVMITPNDDALIRFGSLERRSFMDKTLTQTDFEYLNALKLYNRLLSQRNAMLKQGVNKDLHDLLDSYDIQMIEQGQVIFDKRKLLIQVLNNLMTSMYQFFSDEKETVRCELKSFQNDSNLEQLFKQNREKDVMLKRTTAGPHTDNLSFIINDVSLKHSGSQGQQKTFLLALKLAQWTYLKQQLNKIPILLLDDIFDKLDRSRVNRLMQWLERSEVKQLFLSDTRKERIERIFQDSKLPIHILEIEDGQIMN